MKKPTPGAVVFPLGIFALNCYFAKGLFSLEYSQFMGSIEGAYIAISRYMIGNWRDLTWFPLWYGGIPFQNTYPPLLHAVVALAALVFRISPANAHHFVTALFYALGPVALYALAVRFTGSRWYGFWAGWIYSILSPCLFLMPLVRADSGRLLGPRRFVDLVQYGEGPHVTSLALLPVALLFLDVALEKRTPLWYVLTAAGMAAVALSNWLGTFTLAIAVFAYLVARSSTVDAWKAWLRTLGLGALAYAMACSWIPPSTIRDIRYNSELVGGAFEHAYQRWPVYAAIAVLAALLLKFAMQRLRFSMATQFALLFALLIGAIPLSAEWFQVAMAPQPERFQLELDLAVCLAVALVFRAMDGKIAQPYKLLSVAFLLGLGYFPARLDRRIARDVVQPIDISQTIEYKTAQWFDKQMNGGRVLAPGSISFWMNAFTDTPQFRGGFDQGIVNRTNSRVDYQILSSEGAGDLAAAVAAQWMDAYGVQAIAVGGAGSRETYQPFRRPEVFANTFPVAMREGGDAVYWLPGRSVSLAHVMARQDLVRDQPINGLDLAQMQRYVAALHGPERTPATFRWTSRHSAEIQTTTLRPDQVLSVQITYHPGWHALANGESCRLSGDGLGQMVAEPRCADTCRVLLTYDGGWEMRAARVVSWSSLAGCVLWIVFYRRGR